MPRICDLVDATAGHERTSFLDAIYGYNQIPLYESGRIYTSFVIDKGLYYYRVMPFDSNNAGVTYQILTNYIFQG